MTRSRRIAAVALGGAASAVLLALLWLLTTTAGARFAVNRTVGLLAPRLSVGQVQGSIVGTLHAEAIRWNDPTTGVDVTVASADVDVVLRALLRSTVHVRNLAASGVVLRLDAGQPREQEPSTRAPLDPPIDIRIDALSLRDARVISAGQEQVTLSEAQLAGAWTRSGLTIERLDVEASQGEVHFTGAVAGSDRYRGTGNGRFRWQLPEQMVAGTIEARASDATADFLLRLSAPVAAELSLALQQRERLPWSFDLKVPAFDPRERLAPASSLRRLALALRGSGTLDEALSEGEITLNDTPVAVQRLHARRNDASVDLDARIGFGGGRVDLTGELQTGKTPLSGRGAMEWRAIEIPADLVGQVLLTGGKLEVAGSAEKYTASGAVQIGPPRRLADLQLRVSGTPQAVHLERLDVVQPGGRLTAAGLVLLQPEVSWTVGAAAQSFDPGAIFSQWPGRLDFTLATEGALTSQGPRAQVALQGLRGELRRRKLAGTAALELASDKTLSGKADLASGESRVRIDARRNGERGGEGSAVLEVASLEDWWPEAAGSLRGRIDAAGRWPDIAGTVHLTANDLMLKDAAVGSAQLDADVRRPLDPSGTIALDLHAARIGDFDFSSVRLRAQGDRAANRVSFDAEGPQLTLGLDAAGSVKQRAWQGSVTRLQIDSPDVARLRLEAPFDLRLAAQGSSLGHACLVDGEKKICVEGTSGPPPALQARYSVNALPLGLVGLFVELPVQIEGTLAGEGDLRRDAQGSVFGTARLRSGSGKILEADVQDDARELLTWRALEFDAVLQGDTARLNASAGLNDTGKLDAQVAVSALTGPSPQLDGRVAVGLPGLGVVEAFVPQLLNIQGSLAVDARITGPLDAPRIDGEARISALAFDLPELGLKPRDGQVVARLDGDGPIALQGSLHSGEGTLQFDGEARLDGTARAQITGSNVLGADIPGVKIEVSPKLAVVVGAELTELTGNVEIVTADVNLQRLPNGTRTRSASPDVVVVDDDAERAKAARSFPLRADVEVTLGKAVKVTGYGLDASVTGGLTVRERPGDPTTASGEVRVDGTYTAYAQDLTIRQGQLLFAGTPVDNPRLAILAVREIDEVTAGFRVAGSARNPELTVFSTPAMSQSNALSYIITGKPLDEVSSGTGEGDAVQSAARQLGTAAGGLLAKNVGKRLGVDQFGIEESAALGGAALTLGEYLSPRLYLGYGVGIFEPGQVVTMRYKLSREFSVEAEQGTTNSRASVEFRKEK